MGNASPENVISHWCQLIEGLQESPLRFYELVDVAVKRRVIPDAETSRVDYFEGGVLSAKREYLRVQRGRLVFDICGAPFGAGFFTSSWLGELAPSLHPVLLIIAVLVYLGVFAQLVNSLGFFFGFIVAVLLVPALLWLVRFLARRGTMSDDFLVAIPYLGAVYKFFFRPDTYYSIDTKLMFQQAVHAAVLEAVDAMTSAKGIRGLSELERRPTMKDFTKR